MRWERGTATQGRKEAFEEETQAAAADAVGKVGEDCGGCWLGGGSFRRGEAAREGEGIMASCTQTLRPSVRPTADQLGMRAREDGRRLEGN